MEFPSQVPYKIRRCFRESHDFKHITTANKAYLNTLSTARRWLLIAFSDVVHYVIIKKLVDSIFNVFPICIRLWEFQTQLGFLLWPDD